MSHELTHKKIYAVFFPAILLGSLALFIQIVRYQPLYPKIDTTEQNADSKFEVPILPTDPIIGNRKSPITVIAFEDFSCSACKAQHDLFLQVQQKYPDKIKMIWKGLPVNNPLQPPVTALRYGVCAHEQKQFDQFAAYAFSNSDNLSEGTLNKISEEIKLDTEKLTTCLASDRPDQIIETNKKIANTLNLQSVPTLFIDNKQIQTPETLNDWERILGL
ncbi:MAG: thioredoxin domain-containing protein [Candidatus Magasanikbacteria bacterium]|nr:thioredoxin domain-containing protein [Candidatus Magasanikbacteria bacterium]